MCFFHFIFFKKKIRTLKLNLVFYFFLELSGDGMSNSSLNTSSPSLDSSSNIFLTTQSSPMIPISISQPLTNATTSNLTEQTVVLSPDVLENVPQPVLVPSSLSTQATTTSGGTVIPTSMPGAYVIYNPVLVGASNSSLPGTQVYNTENTLKAMAGGSITITSTASPLQTSDKIQDVMTSQVGSTTLANKKQVKARITSVPSSILPPGIDPNQPLSPEFIARNMVNSHAKTILKTEMPTSTQQLKNGNMLIEKTILSPVSPNGLQEAGLSQSPLDQTVVTPTSQLTVSPDMSQNLLSPISPNMMLSIPKPRDKQPAWRSK